MQYSNISDGGLQYSQTEDQQVVHNFEQEISAYTFDSTPIEYDSGNISAASPGVNEYSVSVTAAADDTLLPYVMPQAEYMYGCAATAVGMLLGYYDLYGYTANGVHYDYFDLIDGTITVDSRGSDGGSIYDMSDSSVLCNFIASSEYVDRFYNTSPYHEKDYTFVNGDPALGIDTSSWNCLADYLGTGQYWRGCDDLATAMYFTTLGYLESASMYYTVDGVTIDGKWHDMKYGLSLYVESAGYSLDRQQTCTYRIENFSFEDYMAEIDAGRPVLIGLRSADGGHMVTGYGYNAETREIIFDDTYSSDCRMTWEGSYSYSGSEYKLLTLTTVVLLAPGTGNPAVETYKSNKFVSAADVMISKTLSSSADENIMRIKNGGVASNTVIGSAGSMHISSGGVATSTAVNSSGYMYVSGGAANNTVIGARGRVYISSGGVANSTVINSSGYMYVSSNGMVNSTTVNSDGCLVVSNGGIADNVTVHNGNLTVFGGGTVNDVTLCGGTLSAASNCVITDTVISGGRLKISSGAVVKDVQVLSGGSMVVADGGTLTGSIALQDGAYVYAYTRAVISMDISGMSAGNSALISDISLIQGSPEYVVTTTQTQTGTWLLAQGASAFNKTVSVKQAGTPPLISLSVNQTIVCGSKSYSLTRSGEDLFISISASAADVPEVLSVSADITAITWQTVTVTAQFSTDCVRKEYYRNGIWQTYTDGVAMDDNGTVWFRGIDANGNISELASYTVSNIDHNIPAPGSEVKTFLNGVQVAAASTLSGRVLQSGGFEDTMNVYSSGIAVNTVINSGGTMQVLAGGIANSTVVNSGGGINLAGGTANNVTVSSGGSVNVSSGGTVAGMTNGGYINVLEGGLVSGGNVSGGTLYLRSNGSAADVSLENYGSVYVSSGAVLNDVAINSHGFAGVSSGIISKVTVNSKGYFTVNSGASVTDLTVNYGGYAYVHDGSNISNVTVEYGGVLNISKSTVLDTNITVRGEFRLHANDVDMNNHTITLDMQNRSSSEYEMIDFLSYIRNYNLAVNLSETQASGTYYIAAAASNFSGTITVNTGNDNFATLKLNDTVTVGDLSLSLKNPKGTSYLTLTVENSGTETLPAEFPDYTFGTWTYSWAQAVEYAKKYNKPILSLYGDRMTCGYTEDFIDNKLETPEFIEFSKNVILLYNTELRIRHTYWTPTVELLTPEGNHFIDRWTGDPQKIGIEETLDAYELSLNIGDNKGLFYYKGYTLTDLGGQSSGVVLDSGHKIFANSASVANTTVNFSGYLFVGDKGRTDSTVINSGGSMAIRNGGVANDSIINRGGYMYISSGGVANDNIISSGGYMYISSGGVANNTVVNSRCSMFVSNGGVANNVTINSGTYILVYSGGTATVAFNPWAGTVTSSAGAVVTYLEGSGVYYGRYGSGVVSRSNAFDKLTVSSGFSALICNGGSANSTTVANSARMYVYNSGTVSNTTVNSGGYMYISSGGVANNTVADDCTMVIYNGAVANNIEVSGSRYSYGLIVSSGGVANNTTLNSGYVYISQGGVINSTIVNTNGSMFVYGTASNTVINAGYMAVYSSSVVNGTVLNSGRIYINNGCLASSTVIGSAGSMLISSGGVANSTTVNSNGDMYIDNGGVANRTTVNSSGYMTIASGGTANSTTVNSGRMYISSGGTANSTTVNSGRMYISSGGTANSTTVNSYGSMYISSGGVANSTTVNSSGRMYIANDGMHRGSLQIASGAVVSAYSGAVIDFTLTDRNTGDSALINDLALVKGAPAYSVTVAASQDKGIYKLAENASAFTGSITLNVGDSAAGTLNIGNSITVGDTAYRLDSADGALLFSISGLVTVNNKNFAYGGSIDSALEDNTVLFVDSGSFKRLYGGNYVDKNRQFVDIGGSVDLTVNGGSFSSVVAAGDHVIDGIVTRFETISTTINGGTFSNNVAGGMCLDIASGNTGMVMAATGDINLTIAGGTFAKRIFGGSISSKAAQSGKMEVTGNINLVLDATEANITINENIAAGNSGYGWVRGDVTVTLKKAANFNLTMNGMLSGATEGASYTVTPDGKRVATSYVEGERTLVLDSYVGDFDGTIFMFENLEVKNNTAMNFTNAKLYTGDISLWDLEYGSTVTGLQRNSFDGDTLDFDLTGWDGSSEWEVLAGTAETFADLSEAARVTLGGQTASWNGAAWVSTDCKLAVDDQENKLVLTAIA